jgi:hypothetical protein
VIGTLRPGMELHIIGTGNYGWMQLETPVGSGWAYGPGYLAGADSASGTAIHSTAPAINSP